MRRPFSISEVRKDAVTAFDAATGLVALSSSCKQTLIDQLYDGNLRVTVTVDEHTLDDAFDFRRLLNERTTLSVIVSICPVIGWRGHQPVTGDPARYMLADAQLTSVAYRSNNEVELAFTGPRLA